MSRLVVDASVAVKWVVQEDGTADALALRRHVLAAPDLLAAECANILWKKMRLKQLTAAEAHLAARLLMRADVELVPMRPFVGDAIRHAAALDHPAYDCVYLSVALSRGVKFVSADDGLVRKARRLGSDEVKACLLSLAEAAKT